MMSGNDSSLDRTDDRIQNSDDRGDDEEGEIFVDCLDSREDGQTMPDYIHILSTSHTSISPNSSSSDTNIIDELGLSDKENDTGEVFDMQMLLVHSDDESSINEPNEQEMKNLEVTDAEAGVDMIKESEEISGKSCIAELEGVGAQINNIIDETSQSDVNYTQEKRKDSILQETKDCYPCKGNCETVAAFSWCQNCDEYLCETCTKQHKSRKATKTHTVVSAEDKPVEPKCDWCSYSDEVSTSVRYCHICEENLCRKCLNKHQAQKSTKGHLAADFEVGLTNSQHACGLCASNALAVSYCSVCDAYLCKSCIFEHLQMNTIAEHTLVSMTESKTPAPISINCSACEYQGHTTRANTYCVDCEEWLCPTCEEQHNLHISDHRLISFDEMQFCKACKKKDIPSKAERLCIDCKIPTALCAECSSVHTSLKPSRGHTLNVLKTIFSPTDLLHGVDANRSKKRAQDTCSNSESFAHNEKTGTDVPGQPTLAKSKTMSIDSVSIHWDPPALYYQSYKYQIRYKEGEAGDWKFHEPLIPGDTHSTTVNKLRSNTVYTFQVRMVNNEKEGPYSRESDRIKTSKSAAVRMLDYSIPVQNSSCPIQLRKVPFTKDMDSFNTEIKSRRLEIGNDADLKTKQRTIMLVGATGSGKSTLVDSMANFIFGVNWDDPFRLSAVDLEEDESDLNKNQALSQTQWITCYTIHPMKGSRLDYTLNIVDTPGFGDTRGIQRDEEIVNQIRMLFNDESKKGIAFVDAICFLVKAPDARLTPEQRYIFDSILSMFGKDIRENICLLITFADGNTPPVLEALRESKLLFEPYFVFNNSGMFASNTSDKASLAPMFWDIGLKNFAAFFARLDQMQTKSLTLTKEVLDKRQALEVTIENILPLIDAGLHKVDDLSNEINILVNHRRDIEANKDFMYKVTETKQIKLDLPKGEHVTNCLQCHLTCHRSCKIAEDDKKCWCSAMDRKTGNCTQCECHWTQHKNTPYIFEYKTEEKQKTYQEKLDQYNIASSQEQSHSIVVSRMEEELSDMEIQLQEKIKMVHHFTNELKKIALRENPLSLEEYIDLLITNEKNMKNEGFLARVDVLLHMKKKSSVTKVFTQFREKSSRVRQNAYEVRSQNRKGKKGNYMFKRFRDFMTPWK